MRAELREQFRDVREDATENDEDVEARLAQARRDLDDKLDELGRRIREAREVLGPHGVIQNPWVRLGAALVIGYAAGRTGTAGTLARYGMRLALTAGVRSLLSSTFRSHGDAVAD
jgi:hypothetical protein